MEQLETALLSAMGKSKPQWEQVDMGAALQRLGLTAAYPAEVCRFVVCPIALI